MNNTGFNLPPEIKHSYYIATANAYQISPALTTSIDVTTCIIGGGYTGLHTLLNLLEQQPNSDVILIEGFNVGYGASGRNGGQVISGYSAGNMAVFDKQLGSRKAEQFWQMSLEAVKLVKQRIHQHNIQCDWRQGYATLACNSSQFKALEKEFSHQAGYVLWDKTQTQANVNSDRYVGGMYDPYSGRLHPLNYCLGLAQAAKQLNARIYENTPALSLSNDNGKIKIITPQATIMADNVVLAVNTDLPAINGTLLSSIKHNIASVGTYIIATEPLGKSRALQLIPQNIAVCDANYVLDYYCLSSDYRLLFGGKESTSSQIPQNITHIMRKDMLRVFPQLYDVKIDYAWGGFCDITMNQAPNFGRLAPNVYFAQGFAGHGVAITALAGKIIAEAILGDDQRLALFEEIRHIPFPACSWIRRPMLDLGVLSLKTRDRLNL